MIKAGVVGLGSLGSVHARNLITQIPNAELIAVCGREKLVKQFTQVHQVPYVYTDYDEMLKNPELEAVLIVTSVNAHFSMVMKAIKANLHIFVEKPLALRAEEAKEAQLAADKNPDKMLMTGYMRRFDSSYREAKRKTDAGEIGKPIMFRGYSLDKDSQAESSSERGAQNGAWYSEMIVHDIDLARWFLGSEVASIRTLGGCYKHPEYEKYHDIDNACTLMSFTNNAMAMFYTGRTAPHGSHVETEIVGTEGIIRINAIPRKDRLDLYTPIGVVNECAADYLNRFSDAFVREIQEFFDCIETGRKPEMTPYDSQMVCTIAEKAYHAYLSQELITL
jgi:myo-inositol 2-dehydrogenase/D-chiro-inositol 1-dehydrogenase